MQVDTCNCAIVADRIETGVLGSNSVQPRLHGDTHYVDRDELHEDMTGEPWTPTPPTTNLPQRV